MRSLWEGRGGDGSDPPTPFREFAIDVINSFIISFKIANRFDGMQNVREYIFMKINTYTAINSKLI